MRDPRTLGPYLPQQPPSLIDLIRGGDGAFSAAPSVAAAAAPPPTVASRITGLASGVGSALAAPVRAVAAPFRAIGEAYDAEMERRRLDNEASVRAGQLADAQFPAQAELARAQARNLRELDSRIGSETDPRVREGLIRGAATGTFRPFELEPGPAELAAYQSVLGIQEEEARQKLITRREQQQAQLEAQLTRQTTAQRLAGELELERGKRALGPAPGSIDDERAMRGQFEGLSKEFSTVRQAYKTLRAVDNTKAGDLTFLVQFMKLIDPGASVREGDLATAENAGGVPSAIRAAYNKLNASEGRIDTRLRDDYLQQAENLYQARLGSHRNIERQYGEIAKRRGLDPRNVVTDFVGEDDAPKAPRRTVNGAEYEKVDGGWRLVK